MRPRHVVVLALLSAIWGASYLLIKYAIRDLSEPSVVFLRTLLAAAALLVYIRLSDSGAWARLGEMRRRPGTVLILGLTAIGGPFLLITYGEQTVPSGLTAVLIAAAPIFVAIFAPFLDRSEVMSGRQWTGLAIGIVGVGLLVGVEQIDSTGAFLGALAMVGAAASYGVSGFVLKRGFSGFPPTVTTFFSTSAAALVCIPFVAVDPPREVPGGLAVFAVVVLGLFGTAAAFVIYFQLIADIGFGRATVVAYTIPPVALLYGNLLLDEPITPATIGGMLLILAGVALVARGADRAAGR